MLGKRLLGAAIIISVMLLLVTADYQLGLEKYLGRPGIPIAGLCVLIAGIAASELVAMWKRQYPRMRVRLGSIAAAIMTLVSCVPLAWQDYPADCPLGKFGWSLSGLIIATVIVFVVEMWSYGRVSEDERGSTVNRISHYVFSFSYLLMLFGFVASHRMIGGNAIGLISIISLIATVKMADAFAYFVGKSVGRHKLAPNLSPKKTVEGAIGSIFGGWAAAAIMLYAISPYVFKVEIDKPWWWFLVYGALITAAGTMGDFAESLIKRDAGVKDSSTWLPGLGGILDIADSLIFAAPVSYFLWAYLK
ncbi:MAG: phosphatidate cytidylyltransferase [Planctomycetota bacterium]